MPMPGDPFYATPQWRAFRAAFLARNPRCSVAGCPVPASHVDHVVSRRRGGADLDPRNCQPLCGPHHSSKTARLDHPGRKASNAPLRVHGCDAAGWSIDPNHPFRRTPS